MAIDDSTTREIPLTRGKVALVDAADYEWLSAWKWHAVKMKRVNGCAWYAYRTTGPRGGQYHVAMHREILRTPSGKLTDHENGDGLNNRRGNLRPATKTSNAHNTRRLRLNKTSAFKGVSWSRLHGKWRATIVVNKRQESLGLFVIEREAGLAYDAAALRFFGEFAAPNSQL